jgi:hypothetical protein
MPMTDNQLYAVIWSIIGLVVISIVISIYYSAKLDKEIAIEMAKMEYIQKITTSTTGNTCDPIWVKAIHDNRSVVKK